MNNSLAREFRFGSLLRFAFPTIIMMLFMSLYTMVDGVFVARFVSTTALSAVNIVFPIVSVVFAIGIMLATGGSAIIAKKLGEGKTEEARRNFSLLSLTGAGTGLLLTVVCYLFLEPILRFLGADAAVFQYCYDYALSLICFIMPGILMVLFQTLFVTAGKPHLGLAVTILGGVANIVLDYVFIVPMGLGIRGAAVATGIGYCLPALFGALYFAFYRKGTLFFTKPEFDGKALLTSCTNGSSEMVTNLSTAVTTFLFNILMMKHSGADGVAAITIVLYAQYLLTAVYLGYSTGTAPVFSFHYGTKNKVQLKRLFRISLVFILVCSVATFALTLLFAEQIVQVFASRGDAVFDMGVYGLRWFSIGFLFTGISIFASALFTAFSDGKISAIISFARTFGFLVLCLLLLPMIMGTDGVWLAVPVAEALGMAVSVFFLCRKSKKYGYQ